MAIYNGYTGAKTCTRGPADGAKDAMAWFLAAYGDLGGRNSGIYNWRPPSAGPPAPPRFMVKDAPWTSA